MRKTALVTGASSGIGKEFATQLAALNYDLVVVARRENLLLELQRELSNVKVVVFPKDLTADNAVEDLIKFLAEARIQIDVLINNAGFGDYNRFDEADIAKLQHEVSHLPKEERKGFRCKMCGDVLSSSGSLSNHKKLKHKIVK